MDYICKYDYFNHNNDFSHNVIRVVAIETTIGVKILWNRKAFIFAIENSYG